MGLAGDSALEPPDSQLVATGLPATAVKSSGSVASPGFALPAKTLSLTLGQCYAEVATFKPESDRRGLFDLSRIQVARAPSAPSQGYFTPS